MPQIGKELEYLTVRWRRLTIVSVGSIWTKPILDVEVVRRPISLIFIELKWLKLNKNEFLKKKQISLIICYMILLGQSHAISNYNDLELK